jgi:hypothetical protein
MATSYKAQALASELADKIRSRGFGGSLLVDAADLNPYVSIGDGTIGGANALLKVKPVDWPLAKDVLGLDQAVFAPHVIQFVTEADPTAGAGANPLTRGQVLGILGQAMAMGCVVEWYESANGDSPDLDDITPAKLKGTFHPDHYHPLVSAQ